MYRIEFYLNLTYTDLNWNRIDAITVTNKHTFSINDMYQYSII